VKPFMHALVDMLPSARLIVTGGAGTDRGPPPPQESLRGDPAMVEKAIRALPNTAKIFPDYDAWLPILYAVKAALPDDPGHALELVQEWCEKSDWTGERGPNDPVTVASIFNDLPGPYRVGASLLYELASKHSGGAFDRAEVWFDQAAADFDPLPFDTGQNPEKIVKAPELFDLLSEEDIDNMPDPVWTIDRHVPEQSVGFLYGDPGTGKSFVALDQALHIAYSRPDWHGDALRVRERATVIYLAGEGAQGFKTRLAAWRKAKGVGAAERGRFRLLKQGVNMMQPEDVRRLAATLRARVVGAGDAVALIVVDTVSRAMPGADENLQKEMTLFVKACDVLRDEFACCVLGVHHAGKNGDMRGSTVLLGAGDFVFKLERKKGAAVGTLHCEKQKDGPDGWGDPYRFDVVGLEGGKSSLVPTRVEASAGVTVAMTPDIASAVISAMDADWKAGDPWSMRPQSGARYAVRRMTARFAMNAVEAEEALRLWVASGVVKQEIYNTNTKAKGLRSGGPIGQNVHGEAGLFD
jgi:hypothetical protein